MPNQFLSPEGDLENYFITEYWLIDQYVGDTLWHWGSASVTFTTLGDNTTVTKVTPVTTLIGGSNWKQVSVGGFNTMAIKTDGTLWGWGNNEYNELGLGSAAFKCTPVTTRAGGTNWKQVGCGHRHTAAIKTDGTLWAWGRNSYGRLGDNTGTDRPTPVTTFAGGTNWKQVSCGGYHTAAIKTDGTLWTWGRNIYGQLGDNTSVSKTTPVTTFTGGINWKQVSCGFDYISAIKTDGTLWTWGRNNTGQLGDNTIPDRSTPVTTFAGGTNWKQVACGNNYVGAIKTNGTLWMWGANSYGQLADYVFVGRVLKRTPTTTFMGGTNWKQVACGIMNTGAIKNDGTMMTWGRGNGSGIPQLSFTTNYPYGSEVTLGAGLWKQLSFGGTSINGGVGAAIDSGINKSTP